MPPRNKKLEKKLSKASMAMENHVFNRLPQGPLPENKQDRLLFQQNHSIDIALEDACIFDENALHEYLSNLNKVPPLKVRITGVFIYLFFLLLPGVIIISICEFLNYPTVAMGENYTIPINVTDLSAEYK